MGGIKSYGTHQIICRFFCPRGNLPTQLVKPIKDPKEFPEVIGIIYQWINEGTGPKIP